MKLLKSLLKKIKLKYRFKEAIISNNIFLPSKTNLGKVKISGNIEIGNYFSCADNTQILAKFDKIIIGNRVSIGPNVLIQNYSHNKNIKQTSNDWLKSELSSEKFNAIIKETSSDIQIGDDVWIGANVVILPGTKIGSGTIIGANSVIKGVFKKNQIIYNERKLIYKDREYKCIF